MRFIALLFSAFLIGSGALMAAGEAPTKGATPQVPEGYEAFFDDYAAFLKKYPEAAKRFSIIDTQSKMRARCEPGEHECCVQWCEGWPHCSGCATEGCCARPPK